MTKHDFLLLLQDRISALPQEDVAQRVDFYGEMIDDRIEEGLTEAEAVAAVGCLDEIAAQILAEHSPAEPSAQDPSPKRKKSWWEILLLVLGAPLWGALALAALAIVLSVYVSVWATMASFWACFGTVALSAPAGVLFGFANLFIGDAISGLALIGAGIFCAGFAIVLFFGCMQGTLALVKLTKAVAHAIRQASAKKGWRNEQA